MAPGMAQMSFKHILAKTVKEVRCQRPRGITVPFHELSRTGKHMEIESRWVVTRSRKVTIQQE